MSRAAISRFQVEWFNVTYRSVFGVIGLLVVLVGGGGAYWYGTRVHGPRKAAREAIARAEGRLADASALRSDEPRLAEVLESAGVALRDARGLLEGMRFDDARGAAIRSENLSQQAIGMVQGPEAGAGQVRFYRLEGDVRVKRAGEFAWEAASARMELRLGDQVKTSSAGSAQLIYFDGTISTIASGSLLEIRELSENPATKVRKVREALTFGEVKASTRAKNVEGSFHEVAAGAVVARTDQESEFRVRASEGKDDASFDVFEGRVEVRSPEHAESLVAGERVRTQAGQLAAKEALPGVPALVTPRDQKVFMSENEKPPEVTLSWEAVPGAARYRLVISDKALFTEPLYDAERSGMQALLEEVPDGAYNWRVAAISQSGVAGPFSPPRRFRVSSERIRDRADQKPPSLELTEFVAVGAMVIVNGRTEPGASLWVENERVDVYDDGTFYAVVRLRKEGLNDLRFVAQDNAGNETELHRQTYLEIF
jgi:hypothetical protein